MRNLFLVVCAALFLASCTASLPAKFTRLADKVESKGANFTEAQWEKVNDQFDKLVQEYTDHYDSFTKEQKKEINKAIMKYNAAAIKYGVGNAAEVVEGILEEIPGFVDGVLDGVKGFLEGLGL